ncbi:MAG: hypothetical protein N2663_07070 [Chlorobi bacterium]|nr:hypothetical protein [Chlorobiota bacterium]
MRYRLISWLGIIALAMASIGCPSDDLINPTMPRWRLLAAVPDGSHTRLVLYSMPDGAVVNDDVYAQANGNVLDGEAVRIEQFRSMLFVLQPNQQRIEVLDATTFRRIARISTAPHAAVAICFANGTTAYTAHGDSTIGVVDLTVFQMVRTIVTGSAPVALAAMGNQVAVCNRGSGTVSIIDSRTNAVTRTVSVAPVPAFVCAASDPATSFCILSIGHGKLDSLPRTPAMLTFYDPFADRVLAQVELSQATADAVTTLPRGVIAGTAATVFILLDSEVQLADAAGQRMLGAILFNGADGGTYNFARELVVLWWGGDSGTTVVAFDPSSGAERGRTTLPVTVRAAAGLY